MVICPRCGHPTSRVKGENIHVNNGDTECTKPYYNESLDQGWSGGGTGEF